MTDVQLNTYNATEQAVPVPFNAVPSEGERELSSRYARSSRAATEITYEFTKDKGLLHQYYVLREQMFVNVWGLTHFSGEEDAIDKRSHVLIIRKGNQVVGGVRLTVKTERLNAKLPMEGSDLKLQDVFPEFGLEYKKYAEFSRLAILPEFSQMDCVYEICRQLKRKCLALGVSYIFSIAPQSLCRYYKKVWKIAGEHEASVREFGAVPDREEYEGIKMHLMYIDLHDEATSLAADHALSSDSPAFAEFE